jgi:hypothetical protein
MAIADCRVKIDGLSIADWRLQIGDCRLVIADWRLLIGDCRLAIADWRSPSIGNQQSQSTINNQHSIDNPQSNRQSPILNPLIGILQSAICNRVAHE